MPLPRPPREMMKFDGPSFLPANDVGPFVRDTFLNPGSELFIPEHEVLEQAEIGYLWAAPEARDKNRVILGTAQLFRPPQAKWNSLRAWDQLLRWFGPVDFIITLSAPFCSDRDTTEGEVLALLDHEHCHCAQEEGEFGPRFSKSTGRPIWGMRGHDVEQFVGVVDRWGAADGHVEELVAAAARRPRFGHVDMGRLLAGCGYGTMAA